MAQQHDRRIAGRGVDEHEADQRDAKQQRYEKQGAVDEEMKPIHLLQLRFLSRKDDNRAKYAVGSSYIARCEQLRNTAISELGSARCIRIAQAGVSSSCSPTITRQG